jgi:hypothetical protein
MLDVSSCHNGHAQVSIGEKSYIFFPMLPRVDMQPRTAIVNQHNCQAVCVTAQRHLVHCAARVFPLRCALQSPGDLVFPGPGLFF